MEDSIDLKIFGFLKNNQVGSDSFILSILPHFAID